MPTSLRGFSFDRILTTTLILLPLVAALACQGKGSERLKPLPPAINPLAGEWHVTSTTTTDTCNLGPGVQPIQGYFSIQVNGTSFTVGRSRIQRRSEPSGLGGRRLRTRLPLPGSRHLHGRALPDQRVRAVVSLGTLPRLSGPRVLPLQKPPSALPSLGYRVCPEGTVTMAALPTLPVLPPKSTIKSRWTTTPEVTW